MVSKLRILVTCLVIHWFLSDCLAQSPSEQITECVYPPPTSNFVCNNETGVWEIEKLIVEDRQRVVFQSPCLISGDLVFKRGSIAEFKSHNVTSVGGITSIASKIILNFGSTTDEGLFYDLTSKHLKTMILINGKGFQVSNAALDIQFKGGCTKIYGSLNLLESKSLHFPVQLAVTHIKKTGTGNCHWLWSSISAVAAIATLVIVPVIEKYVWKIYD